MALFFGWGRCPVDFNRLKGLPRNFHHTTDFYTGAGMSLIKKKHQHIRDEYLRFTLLNVDDFIDTHYIFRSKKKYHGLLGKLLAIIDRQSAEEEESKNSQEHYIDYEIYGSNPYAFEQFKDFLVKKEYFGSKLMRLIENKGLDPVEVYKRANIDRKLFSKIKSQECYIPGKRTIIALAIAMELSLEETEKLLREAGFAFSPSILFDVIIEYFISHQKYDFDEINATLYMYNQPIF